MVQLAWRRRDRLDWPWGHIYLGAAIVSLPWWLLLLRFRFGCVFKGATGLACPTCGATRLVEHVLGGDLMLALLYNPGLFFAGLAGAFLVALHIYGYHTRRVPVLRIDRRGRRAVPWIAVAGLALNWTYLNWMGI